MFSFENQMVKRISTRKLVKKFALYTVLYIPVYYIRDIFHVDNTVHSYKVYISFNKFIVYLIFAGCCLDPRYIAKVYAKYKL